MTSVPAFVTVEASHTGRLTCGMSTYIPNALDPFPTSAKRPSESAATSSVSTKSLISSYKRDHGEGTFKWPGIDEGVEIEL